ncbi:hypothetical protein CWI37_1201p0020, partial [Hamiltosporidium tvaerminnensis]
TSQDSLQIVETEKLRKYDLLANELGLIYKCSVEIIPYVMTWDGIVTKYHKSHLKRLEIPMNVEAYIQSIVLKKTVETISFDRRRGLESGLNAEENWERASMGVIMRSEMHEEPIPPLKEAKREEDGVKILKPKNNTPLISQGGTTLEEPTNNINEESDLEEETIVVKEKPSATEYKKNVLSILIYNDTDSSVSKRIFNQQYLDVLTDYFSKLRKFFEDISFFAKKDIFNCKQMFLGEYKHSETRNWFFDQLLEFSFNNNFVSRASFHKNRIILSIAEIQTQSSSKEPKKTLETAIKRKTSTENHLVINMLFQGFSNLIADIICYFPNFEDLYKFLEDNDEKKLEYRTDLFSNRLIFSPIKSKYRMESIDDLSFKNLNLRLSNKSYSTEISMNPNKAVFSKYKASKDLPDSNIIDSLCDTEVATNKFTEFLKKLEVKEKKKPNQGKSKIFCILNLNEFYEEFAEEMKTQIKERTNTMRR